MVKFGMELEFNWIGIFFSGGMGFHGIPFTGISLAILANGSHGIEITGKVEKLFEKIKIKINEKKYIYIRHVLG